MNPPTSRPPSRFIRGRARGGGAYRPYFYFRRGGKTIPAGGPNTEASVPNNRGYRRGGRGYGRGSNKSNAPLNTSGILPPAAAIDSTFLRPEHYAAPENAIQVQSISIDNPVQCPGWRLYIVKDAYTENSELVQRIRVLEKHYNNNPEYYDLLKINADCEFTLKPNVITNDDGLKEAWPSLLSDLKLQPRRTLATFGLAMHSVVNMALIDASLSMQACDRHVYVPRYSQPRKIYARPVDFIKIGIMSKISNADLDSLYCVRGAVAAIGDVEAKASWIAYKCSRCRQEQAIQQTGFYQSRPNSCKGGGCLAKKGFIEMRSSPYTRIKPVQIIRLSETSIQAPFNANAEVNDSIDIELHYNLVNSVYPGQEVIVTGILKQRTLVEEQEYQRSDTFAKTRVQIFLSAVSVIDAKYKPQSFTERDLEAITMINDEANSFKLLVHSIAPELYAQEMVKAGILLSLFGGSGSQIHDESAINVLLVGDPGIGKSHVVQMCAKVTERGSFLSGKNGAFSATKLSVVVSGRTHLTLDAGGALTAQHGHCSIDDIDRLASQQETLLQLLQSQIITVPFPSIFATFIAPTAVVATANPLRGHYDQSKLLMENIRVSPALMTEFHLVFVLLDKPSKEMDTTLTEHIKALHAGSKKSAAIAERFAMKPKTNNSLNMSMDIDDNIDDANYDLSRRLVINAADNDALDPLPPVLIKKYIAYTRQQVKPLLNDEAAEALKEFYMELRQNQTDAKFSTFSTSLLAGLIRLTQARARIDFSGEATKVHVRDVLSIVRHSMADTAVGDYRDVNTAGIGGAVIAGGTSQNSMAKKFIQVLQMRSDALGRRIFDFDELKDMARHAGISCGVTNLVDIANFKGFLLKKGPNMYEVMED